MIKLNKKIKVSSLSRFLNLKYIGKDKFIQGFGDLGDKKDNILCFSNNSENNFKNKIIIQKKKTNFKNCTIILSRKPRLTMSKILNFFLKKNFVKILNKKNSIHKSVKVSKNSIIGNNIKIEKNCIIENGAKIFSNVIIKKNSIIRSGAIIGAYGFGYERNEKKIPILFPQFGLVQINQNVHVGNNSCIVSGTFNKTIINDNTKIDNLVHIYNNVKIGKNFIITAKCQIEGSVNIGNNVWLSPSSSIINKVSINDNAFIGIGSVVIFDVKKNDKVFGNPAQSLKK